MITIENLRKSYAAKNGRHLIFDNVSATFPTGQSVGIIGRNGVGKSTLLNVISGVEAADHGRVLTDGNISYPVGYGGAFHAMMTGAQAARFVARVYGADTDEIIIFVEKFSELGRQLYEPLHTYSSGQRSRLSMAISMAIPFDIYLIDEIGAVGDENFKMKSRAILHDRMENADIVIVDHGMRKIRAFCSIGAVIHNKRIHIFHDIEEAIALYGQVNRLAKQPASPEPDGTAKAPWVTRVVEGLFGRARLDDE